MSNHWLDEKKSGMTGLTGLSFYMEFYCVTSSDTLQLVCNNEELVQAILRYELSMKKILLSDQIILMTGPVCLL